jgi:hypothetical protein
MPATDNLGGADVFQTPHRSRSGLQPAVISLDRVVAYCSTTCHPSGTSSSSTRGYAGARSVLTPVGRRATFKARAKNRRVAYGCREP